MTSPLKVLHPHRPIPLLGFGTYKVDQSVARDTVKTALALGYRHIDTAQMYGNEAGVGDAIVESGVPRQSLYITTKLNNPNHAPERVRASFAESLRKLKTPYVDLFLMHWPLPHDYNGDFSSTYAAMEDLVLAGTAKSIGVSNFEIDHLRTLAANTTIKPVVNQIELHPYFQNREVAQFCRERRIAVEAWSPLGRGKELADPVIIEIAQAYGATPAQVVLAWHHAHGNIAIPKASGIERQLENFDSLHFTLSAADVAAIDALDRGEEGRMGPHPNVMRLS